MKARHARSRVLVALVVLAAHLALLLWWLRSDRLSHGVPPAQPRVAVRLIALPPLPAPRSEPAVTARERHAAPRARAPVSALPMPKSPEAISVAPLAAEAPASQAVAEPPPSLMDGEATRRAIRAAAREPGLAAQAGRQGPALRTPDERLGDQVQQSAKGDCLKGEYLGGGMGLLSLPFLAAAALKGDCRR